MYESVSSVKSKSPVTVVEPPLVHTTSSLEKQINNMFKGIEKDQSIDDDLLNKIDQLKRLVKISLKRNYEREQEDSQEFSENDKLTTPSSDGDSYEYDIRRSSGSLKIKKLKKIL